MAKINSVRQPNESLATFLERIMEAFRQYTPMDPQADESRAAVMLAFVNQAAPDIKKKLQKIERLSEQSLQDLVRATKRFLIIERPQKRERTTLKEKKENLELKKTIKIKKSWPRYFLLGLKTKTGSKKEKNWTQKLKKK